MPRLTFIFIPVSARVSGYVIKVNVDDNQYVEKGTVLVEIDPKDYEVAVAKAQANLANAEATAQSLNITVPITSVNTASQLKVRRIGRRKLRTPESLPPRSRSTAAHAQLEQAEANDVKAQDDLRRYKSLVDKQEVAEQIYDQAVAAAKASTASVAAADANEAAAQQVGASRPKASWRRRKRTRRSAETGPQQVSSTRARARAAIADVEQKRALLEQAQLNLQYTKIVAPVSGEVNKTVVVGMNVASGPTIAHRGAA